MPCLCYAWIRRSRLGAMCITPMLFEDDALSYGYHTQSEVIRCVSVLLSCNHVPRFLAKMNRVGMFHLLACLSLGNYLPLDISHSCCSLGRGRSADTFRRRPTRRRATFVVPCRATKDRSTYLDTKSGPPTVSQNVARQATSRSCYYWPRLRRS